MRLVLELSGPLTPQQRKTLRLAVVILSAVLALALLAATVSWFGDYDSKWRQHASYSLGTAQLCLEFPTTGSLKRCQGCLDDARRVILRQRKYLFGGARRDADRMLAGIASLESKIREVQ